MRRCLRSAHLPCLDHRFSLLPRSSTSPARLFGSRAYRGLQAGRFSPGRRQWGRQFSVASNPPFDRRFLKNNVPIESRGCPVSKEQVGNPEVWMSLLEQYIPPSLRKSSEDAATTHASSTDESSERTQESFAQTIELVSLILHGRSSGHLDLLSYLGFQKRNWPAVHALLSRLLDASDALNGLSMPLRPLSNLPWGSDSSVSLARLAEKGVQSAPQFPRGSEVPLVPGFTDLDSLTLRPLASEHSMRLMAEVWKSLGSIVLDAADAPPNESKLAMSYVFRVLARLHHSGAVSDRVYKYTPADSHQTVFRPPGMHWLSNHIMTVLTDAAWLVHEAEVAAKAAAAGQDSPYLPVKIGVRELGPEIWLELILWCCVEHGHIRDGIWLVQQMQKRSGDQAWKFQSWKPLLEDVASVQSTNVKVEDSWRHPGQTIFASSRQKHTNPPPFNGLGKRTISLEVVASLLDNFPNLVYLGLGYRGVLPPALLNDASSLSFAFTQDNSDGSLRPTSKASNWFTARVIESGGFNPEEDPQIFERLLRASPNVVPPWDHNLADVDEEFIERLTPSEIYDDTAAFTGLIEYNIRCYSLRRLTDDTIKAFGWLQDVIDASKMESISDFFSSRVGQPQIERLPVFKPGNFASLKPLETSMPQLSIVTLAHVLDLVTVSKAYSFGEWLLFSTDIDGPPVPPSAYGNQALAPSIVRFAAATKNLELCDSVLQRLLQPISANTLRALLNFRIVMGQWDLAFQMLQYLRDYKLKSWGHGTVTTLAAEIIRRDHALPKSNGANKTSDEIKLEKGLAQAKDLLYRLLIGEFNEFSYRHSNTSFQARSLYGLHRVFQYIPGALRETATAATPRLQHKATSHSAIPIIPPPAFHTLLSAVVDTQGSVAGQRLWMKCCVDGRPPTRSRIQKGGISRFYSHEERNLLQGDSQFDARYFQQLQKKAAIPNVATVRIIADAALREYNAHRKREFQARNVKANSVGNGATSSRRPQWQSSFSRKTRRQEKIDAYIRNKTAASNPARRVLKFCILKFQSLGLRASVISREVEERMYGMSMERRRSESGTRVLMPKKLLRKGRYVFRRRRLPRRHK